MCGRYYIEIEEKELWEIVRQAEQNSKVVASTGEIYPTNLAPVIQLQKETLQPSVMKWGFPVAWGAKKPLINARAETLYEKKSFKEAALERRCGVPASGFYEWKEIKGQKKKEKRYFTYPNTPLFYFAGIYETYKNDDGNPQEHYCIITRDANESMKDTHHRMPVILRQEEMEHWICGDEVSSLLASSPILQNTPI